MEAGCTNTHLTAVRDGDDVGETWKAGIPCATNSSVGFSHTTSMALPLIFQNTRLEAKSTLMLTGSCWSGAPVNCPVGMVRGTIGTSDDRSSHLLSGGALPLSVGIPSGTPSYVKIAAGWGCGRAPQAPVRE